MADGEERRKTAEEVKAEADGRAATLQAQLKDSETRASVALELQKSQSEAQIAANTAALMLSFNTMIQASVEKGIAAGITAALTSRLAPDEEEDNTSASGGGGGSRSSRAKVTQTTRARPPGAKHE